ncbi:MAG: hypothetical protein ACRC28_17485 [Clostridium sp.]|uniref:hypothetical protein n=1 Tax=Clostridium sp. TaxID=1506 RepID=UPI003F2B4F00
MKKIVISVIVAILILAGLIFNTVREVKLTDNFKAYYKNTKTEYSEILIGKYRKDYEEYVRDSEQAIKFKAVKAMEKIETKYNGLKSEAITYDKEYIGGELTDLSNINLSKLKPTDREAVQNQIQQAIELAKQNKFDSAYNLIVKIKQNINSKLKER